MGKVKLRPQKPRPDAKNAAWYNVCKRTAKNGTLHTFRINSDNVPEPGRQRLCGEVAAQVMGNAIRSMVDTYPDPEQATYEAEMGRLMVALDLCAINMGLANVGSSVARDRREIAPVHRAQGQYALVLDVFPDGMIYADLLPRHTQPPEWERDPNADAPPAPEVAP